MRRSHLVALAMAAFVVVAAASALPAVGQTGGASKLSKHDQSLVSEARAKGQTSVTVMVAAKAGVARDAARQLEALGATIVYRDMTLGYLRGELALDRVETAANLNTVGALDVDEAIQVPDPEPQGAVGVIPQPVPNAATPRVNPYMPTQDTGAAQFVNAHPTWDGRGVTIGIVDTGISLDHPSLLTTSTGDPKIENWITGTSPFDAGAALDPTWINMSEQVSATPTFVFKSITFTAPSSGSYRVGFFEEANPRFGGEYNVATTPGGDLNRDGDETDKFYLLWNTSSNNVFVDVDQDDSFADEPAMTDYKVAKQVRRFGVDRAATPVVDEVPFVIQTDGKNKFVNIGIVAGAHGSHVAGIAAGNALFGGDMSGAAPGAKIVSSRACLWLAGCFAHALNEGMIEVAKQENVDVINMSIGGLPALNDGNNTRCVLYDRLIETYNVQMFISMGNDGPGLNTAGDPGLCDGVVAAGAYITDDTYLSAYGAQLYEQDNLHYFSSRGPREDGAFDPEIVAPGAAISSIPRWQAQGCLAQTCPVGYALFNGTSMAAPQSTGAGALLVSAAQQFGAQHQPDQIRKALLSSSRYLAGRYQAYEQGVGLINVGAAWDLLKTNLKTVDISSSVPVNTILSGFLATPGVGKGIYDREGVTAGDSYTRTYTFTRNDGPGGTITYNLLWVDNDGTFTTAGSIALPKGVPVTLPVTVHPTTSGVHSAILQLSDSV